MPVEGSEKGGGGRRKKGAAQLASSLKKGGERTSEALVSEREVSPREPGDCPGERDLP